MAQWVRNLPAVEETKAEVSSIPGLGVSPGGGHGNPLQYSGKSHGQRSLAGCSPWGHRVGHDGVHGERATDLTRSVKGWYLNKNEKAIKNKIIGRGKSY